MASAIGRQRQGGIYLNGMAGRRPNVPVAPGRLEEAALARMSREAAAYIAGGAGAERTIAANREAFDRWRIVPRMLRDVAERDLSVELFGRRLPAPVLLAPIGVLELVHRNSDLAVARAAAAMGAPFITSNQASRPMEAVAEACGDGPRWFQLYWSVKDELVESFVQRAEASGYEAIVVTLDTTQLGWRPRDLDLGYLPFLRARGIANYVSDPVFRAMPEDVAGGAERPNPGLGLIASLVDMLRAWPERPLKALVSGEALAAVRRFIAIYSRPNLSWDDLPFLRERTKLPILLKGILDPEDARRAVDSGVDGIIVSNHGGRQVDGAIGALDALARVTEAIDDDYPVLFDSGVRTGADVIKALSLGARAVLLGRPYVYGLALGGETGVREVIANLIADLDLSLALAGYRNLAELDRNALAPT